MNQLRYLPVQIVTIPAGKTISFDLYMQKDNQFIKFLDKGHQIEDQDLEHLKQNNVPRLYIDVAEEEKYDHYIDEIMRARLPKAQDKVVEQDLPTKRPLEKKALPKKKSKKLTLSPEFSGMLDTQEEDQDDKMTKTLQAVVDLFQKSPKKLEAFYGKRVGAISTVIEHAKRIFELSFHLREELELTEKNGLLLSIAAALHDCGMQKLKEADTFLFLKKYADLSSFEKRCLNEHLQAGVDLIKDKKFYSQDLGDLIRHHEENLKGTGPLGVKELSFEQELLSLLNCYEIYTHQVHNLNENFYPEFKEKFKGHYSKKAINALGKCLLKLGEIKVSAHEQLRLNEVA